MSISDLLNSSGSRSFKFEQPGASVSGVVTSAEVVQKRNFDTNEPEFWGDGKPVQQIRVTIQTNQRDTSDPEDDGQRSIYIKGWGDQLRTLRAALKVAGADDIGTGGTFTATYVRDGDLPAGKRGFPPKVYEYFYAAPSGAGALLTEHPAATTAPPADLSGLSLTPEQIAAIQNLQKS